MADHSHSLWCPPKLASHCVVVDGAVVVVPWSVVDGAVVVVPWSVVDGAVVTGCSVVVAGAITSFGVWPPNQPPYQPIMASPITTATAPKTAFLFLFIVSSLTFFLTFTRAVSCEVCRI